MNSHRLGSHPLVLLAAGACLAWAALPGALPDAAAADDGQLRIICFGAHPDDCEIQAGGVGRPVGRAGAQGEIRLGDQRRHRPLAGGRRPAGPRRKAEVASRPTICSASTTEVLDIHDGELLPTLENRRTITRLIREWKADIVIGPRPNDYHPDHRYTGVLVQDAAYMVTVPFFCPDVPPLQEEPGVPLLPRPLPEAQSVPAGRGGR